MGVRVVLGDAATASVAGYVGTKVMEPLSMALYRAESPETRAREDAAMPGPPYRLAAEKSAKTLRLDLSDKTTERAGMGFHYGLAVSRAPLYGLARRRAHLGGPLSALLTGAVADDTLTPLLGFSAPRAKSSRPADDRQGLGDPRRG
ncbi:MAG: DUF1440 domain-containing protein [Acidimicrobiales bacterium]